MLKMKVGAVRRTPGCVPPTKTDISDWWKHARVGEILRVA